ncbi:MAG: DUF6452 family protein [Tenacibaculum sp.]
MKSLGILFLSFLVFASCEKDDICTQIPVTPNLVLRFYNKDTITALKVVRELSVIANGKTDSLLTRVNLDSIAIPLNGQNTQTIYSLYRNIADQGQDIELQEAVLTVNYTAETDFVSRSCGFRYVFKNVELINSELSWIDSLSVTEIPEINNQLSAHVQVFH